MDHSCQAEKVRHTTAGDGHARIQCPVVARKRRHHADSVRWFSQPRDESGETQTLLQAIRVMPIDSIGESW